MNFKYLSGLLISIPFLPLMYYQGQRIRKQVPKLPEAEGGQGRCYVNGASRNTIRVITVGESTIAGVGVETHQEGFTGTFAVELSKLFNQNVHWKVYARSGYTARSVEKRIIPLITENYVDLIIIGLGGNDAFTLNRPSKWKTDIKALVESLQAKFPNAIIVFSNMPPIKEFPAFTPLIKFIIGNLVEILGEELQNVVSNYDQVFFFNEKITLKGWIDKFQLREKKAAFFSDGVHPSKLTYQTWALDIARNIFKNDQIRTALQDVL